MRDELSGFFHKLFRRCIVHIVPCISYAGISTVHKHNTSPHKYVSEVHTKILSSFPWYLWDYQAVSRRLGAAYNYWLNVAVS